MWITGGRRLLGPVGKHSSAIRRNIDRVREVISIRTSSILLLLLLLLMLMLLVLVPSQMPIHMAMMMMLGSRLRLLRMLLLLMVVVIVRLVLMRMLMGMRRGMMLRIKVVVQVVEVGLDGIGEGSSAATDAAGRRLLMGMNGISGEGLLGWDGWGEIVVYGGEWRLATA